MEINFMKGSKLICEECDEIIQNFAKYKNDVINKQKQFSILVSSNEHQDLKNIEALSIITSTQEDFRQEVLIKVEPLELPLIESIFSDPSSSVPKEKVPKKIRKKTVIRNPRPKKKKKLCVDCDKYFCDIISHRVKYHDLEHQFECEQCSFKTLDLKEFRFHKKNDHKSRRKHEDSGICPYCALLIKTSLDDHIANIHKREKYFFCDLCDFGAYRKLSIEYHILHNHCMEKSFNCTLCNFSTITKHRLRNHVKNMHEEVRETLSCIYAECNKTFHKKPNLVEHIKRCHEGELKYTCEHPGCERKFFSQQERRAHFGNAHGPKNVICDTCGKSYSSNYMLRKHLSVHMEFNKVCQYCNIKVRTTWKLKDHIKRCHLFQKDHKCEQCGEEFYKKRALDQHIVSKHLGIRYHCGVAGCNSTLSRKDAYITHLRSHSSLTPEEKNVLLEECEKFIKLHNLPK